MDSDKKTRVLVIEDTLQDAQALFGLLGKAGKYIVEFADCLAKGLRRAKQGGIDIVILDLELPDSQGLNSFTRLYTEVPHIPIVVWTTNEREEVAVQAVQCGAQDHLIKDFVSTSLLVRSLRYSMERHKLVSELEDEKRREHYFATHDKLTGLPNRYFLTDYLKRAISNSNRTGKDLAVMFIDLDQFKPINDGHGHEVGDQLLQEIAKRLSETIRQSDLVVRLGGDEFVALINHLAGHDHCSLVAHKIHQEFVKPVELEHVTLSVTPSIGVALCPKDGSNSDGLIRKADAAMYYAKRDGGNRVRFFNRDSFSIESDDSGTPIVVV